MSSLTQSTTTSRRIATTLAHRNPLYKKSLTDALSKCIKRMTCMKCRWSWLETIYLISTPRITIHCWLGWRSNTWNTCVYLSKCSLDIKLKFKRWPELERYQRSTPLSTSLIIKERRKKDNSSMFWQSMFTKNLAMQWFNVNQRQRILIRTLHYSSFMTIDKITSSSK